MAGSLEYLQPQARIDKRCAVFHRHKVVLCFGAGTEVDVCAATVTKFQVAGNEVGVKVSEEDVADGEPKHFRVGEVLLNVALWVDQDSGGAGLVSDQVGGVRQAAQVVLLEDHGIVVQARERSRKQLSRIPGAAIYFRFRASSSSSVRGQSLPSRRERLRSASTLPPVWQAAQ